MRSTEIVQTSEKPGEERNRDTAGKYSRDDFLEMRKTCASGEETLPTGDCHLPWVSTALPIQSR